MTLSNSSSPPSPRKKHAASSASPSALTQAAPVYPPLTNSTVVSSPKKHTKPGTKPRNIFSNDGSFLERLQRLRKASISSSTLTFLQFLIRSSFLIQQEEEEKKKAKELLDRKKKFADRFKSRGKRPSSDSPDAPVESAERPTKKAKTSCEEQPLNDYQQELQSMSINPSLKDAGTGVRPLVK
ncbi:hypothetical protein FA15DRAFT_655488 [Coprinopsis marcescibilis]|uniref:Uncharacterized protein n=1 Tax=Coprinopsis marcescibilis TaxID=230819 RepID=A0A5C3KWP4_COPMA|nr:hypothetical protein FA15DRAFT_655488 [Coprinopsis marcescibilis]